ncbi:hypothetical protein C5167_015586 [Papaver somniferum]|uniref:Agenet domain-containing protein n=2 Tax=Papaver somniferum TaxID=3469 RepID=A0A4Y7J9K8_PAPSO|nr:uncharacterized protein LOC113358648 isoform X1 [Papaver somniferum]RZC56732.1 hypothetical protein C5167_015586 [Papaver somniferum]
MKVAHKLPFEVGQQAEAKSFQEGYRGAWFRCKILDCGQRGAEPAVALDYIDYINYKKSWIQLYRLCPAEKHSDFKKRYLMLRPSYPQMYHRSQMPDICEISELVGVVDGDWEPGDLVDWFKDGCYWSAWITEVIDEENVQVQLPEPPMGEGEGQTHKVSCKDIRPSLDWTPELGWIAPISKVGKTSRRRVRLIHPTSPGKVRNNAVGSSETPSYVSARSLAGSVPPKLSADSSGRENLKQVSDMKIKNSSPEPPTHSLERDILKKQSCNFLTKQKTDASSIKIDSDAEKNSLRYSSSSADGDNFGPVLSTKDVASAERRKLALHSLKRKQKHSYNLLDKQKADTSITTENGAAKTSLSDNVSTTDGDKFEPVLARKEVASRDVYDYCDSSKKMRRSEIESNSTSSDTLESCIMDLEGLINRVKWLKGALAYGVQFSSLMQPSLTFLETRHPLQVDNTALDL